MYGVHHLNKLHKYRDGMYENRDKYFMSSRSNSCGYPHVWLTISTTLIFLWHYMPSRPWVASLLRFLDHTQLDTPHSVGLI